MHLDYDATIATSHLRRGTSEEAEVLMAEAYPESGCPRNLPAPDAIAPATHPASPARAHTHRWGAFFCPVQCFPPELRRDGKIVFGPPVRSRRLLPFDPPAACSSIPHHPPHRRRPHDRLSPLAGCPRLRQPMLHPRPKYHAGRPSGPRARRPARTRVLGQCLRPNDLTPGRRLHHAERDARLRLGVRLGVRRR
jgi:hypothetical protein